MNSIRTLDYFKNNKLAYVKINESFKQKLENEILNKHGSFDYYGVKKLNLSRSAIRLQFKVQKYFQFIRILKIIEDFNISSEELYDNVLSLLAKGSNTSKELIIPKKLNIDEFFVEGYALY